jgi:superfamily I DNA and/or RNA helicase
VSTAVQADSGRGYNLDISLFERLVLSGFPYAALQTQHRMRPEISTLVRNLMYPTLLDAPTVQTHPPLRGAQRSAFLIAHEWPEGREKGAGKSGKGTSAGLAQLDLDLQSKVNAAEAKMAVVVLRYCLQQGYAAENIALLTPYLGQLSVLRAELESTKFDFSIDERDAEDLLAQVRKPF